MARKMLALLMALGLVAAGCSDDADTATFAGNATTEGQGADAATDGDSVDPAEIEFDYGVTEDTIRIGMLPDLSGPFAAVAAEIVEAQQVYWEMVNENGGIAGRQVELEILDQGYDVPRHIEQYQQLRQEGPEGVAIISLSTGSPHTSAIARDLEQDDIIALPLTWYSGWADPDFGANAAELYTNYCNEAMNTIQFLHEKLQEEGRDTRLAVISTAGEAGQDGATGAKIAAEALGLEIVYDGEAQIVAGADQTPIISELLGSDPTLVYIAANPATTAEIFGGATAQGLEAYWTGYYPTFHNSLLGTDLGEDLSQYYFHSAYTSTWGADVPGMAELVEEMTARRPELPISDNYIIGWTQAMLTHQLLEHAASRGDLTREGIVEAFNDPGFVADFGGLAPEQTWAGDPNEYIVRESYIYSLSAEDYNLGTLSEGDGSTGLVLEEGPYVSDVAAEYEWDGPCFESQA